MSKMVKKVDVILQDDPEYNGVAFRINENNDNLLILVNPKGNPEVRVVVDEEGNSRGVLFAADLLTAIKEYFEQAQLKQQYNTKEN